MSSSLIYFFYRNFIFYKIILDITNFDKALVDETQNIDENKNNRVWLGKT